MDIRKEYEYLPRYHFTAKGWINDPNGFVHFKGKYHLFFQHYIDGAFPGTMSWGHAISDDLITFEILQDAFTHNNYYDSCGCWSGSSIVKDDVLYIYYTGNANINGQTIQTQNLVVSKDGITFTKYANNPILSEKDLPCDCSNTDFRDPSVFEEDGVYYMLLGNRSNTQVASLLLFTSTDLINWHFERKVIEDNCLGYMIECPTTVKLENRRALIMSPQGLSPRGDDFWNVYSSVYLLTDSIIRNFDLNTIKELDHGFDFYAPQVISQGDIMISWLQLWERTFPFWEMNCEWTNAFSIPRKLSLQNGRLIQKPVDTLQKYFANRKSFECSIKEECKIPGLQGNCLHLHLEFAQSNDLIIRFLKKEKYYIDVTYQNNYVILSRNNTYIPIASHKEEKSSHGIRQVKVTGEVIVLDLYLDRLANEIYVNEGEEVLSVTAYHPDDFNQITFESKSGNNIKGYYEFFTQKS